MNSQQWDDHAVDSVIGTQDKSSNDALFSNVQEAMVFSKCKGAREQLVIICYNFT